jgi:hypothetical protein
MRKIIFPCFENNIFFLKKQFTPKSKRNHNKIRLDLSPLVNLKISRQSPSNKPFWLEITRYGNAAK